MYNNNNIKILFIIHILISLNKRDLEKKNDSNQCFKKTKKMQTFLECMGRHVFKIIVVGRVKQKQKKKTWRFLELKKIIATGYNNWKTCKIKDTKKKEKTFFNHGIWDWNYWGTIIESI